LAALERILLIAVMLKTLPVVIAPNIFIVPSQKLAWASGTI